MNRVVVQLSYFSLPDVETQVAPDTVEGISTALSVKISTLSCLIHIPTYCDEFITVSCRFTLMFTTITCQTLSRNGRTVQLSLLSVFAVAITVDAAVSKTALATRQLFETKNKLFKEASG